MAGVYGSSPAEICSCHGNHGIDWWTDNVHSNVLVQQTLHIIGYRKRPINVVSLVIP